MLEIEKREINCMITILQSLSECHKTNCHNCSLYPTICFDHETKGDYYKQAADTIAKLLTHINEQDGEIKRLWKIYNDVKK